MTELGRSPGGGSTSSGSEAPGSRRTPTSPGRGAPRSRGWDARETIFLEALDGIEVDIGGEPSPPAGFEVVVSTAHAGRVEGRSRAEFLAELVALRRSIVVGGAHGKTTTAAMIAYVLGSSATTRRGSSAASSRSSAGTRASGTGWLVVEGDESDRSIALLRPEIAVVTNVELDHHATYASEAELAAFFDEWLDAAPHAVRGWELDPVELELAVPGEHNRRNAAAALAALELAGVARADAERAIAGFSGVGRRFELVGERGGVRVVDDYGHNPTEIAAALATARDARATCADRRLPAPRLRADAPSPPRARSGPRCRGRRGRHGRDRRPRRAAAGRHREARARPRSSADAAWLGADPRRRGDARARVGASGDVVVTLGVGEPWRIARAVVEGLPDVIEIEHGVPLSRLTTIGTGGPARAFARPRTVRGARRGTAVRAATKGSTSLVVGLGSNMLAADEGVDALVLRLEGELAGVEARRACSTAGGGATNAVCLHRARAAGLGGFEFACAIPGTAGGGVCMNAGAYGRDWSDVLVRALVVSGGRRRRG